MNIYSNKLGAGCVMSFISNTNEFNLLRFKFTSTSGIAATDNIDVEFPNVEEFTTNVNYYA